MQEFDVVVIGSGSAGTAAALGCRNGGRSVAVIESGPLGGTCALRGCDPKKVLVQAARAADAMRRYAKLGVFEREPRLDWAALMRFKRSFTDPVPAQRQRTYDDAGIVTIHGRAAFADERTLGVGEEMIGAQRVVIATGARPQHVADGDEELLTSDAFLELEALPESLVFVGGGYIAFEFAHIAARAGSRVTILQNGPHALAGFDPVLTTRLVEIGESLGITVSLNTTVERVTRERSGIRIDARRNGDPVSFSAAAGVLAAGRIPDLDSLHVERAGVQHGKKGVVVNAYLQSVSNAAVYAAGDTADGGGKPLTPVAGDEGAVVAANILHEGSQSFDARGLASIVYSIPSLATVGMSEEAARAEGVDVTVHAGDMSSWYSTRSVAQEHAYYRLFAHARTGAIVGGSILGPHAEEQINVLACAIRNDLRVDTIAATLFAYPTGASDLAYMLDASS